MKPGWRILMVDLIGGTIVLSCLGGTVWLTMLRQDHTAAELAQLKRDISVARRALAALRAERDRERVVLRERKRELAENGALPERAPVEQYFQTLSSIARRHHLQVLRQNPLPSQTYPGLLERRYAYEVSGQTPDIERFLLEIEQTDFWADVGFLKIQASGPTGDAWGNRMASLTISVFSALSSDEESKQG